MDTEKQKRRSSAPAVTEAEPPLSPYRAFVVQFRAGGKKGYFAGRAEHMVSGQATHFHSAEELLGFMERVLSGIREKEGNS